MNEILKKSSLSFSREEEKLVVKELCKRLVIELEKKDKSGIYGVTQYQMAYNSNKIEGSKLTQNQTISLFETGTVGGDGEIYHSKDIEHANGHFLMFNNMLGNYDAPLTVEMIKGYHYDLKAGVFEDKANGYKAGEFKERVNRVGSIATSRPEQVEQDMKALLDWYHALAEVSIMDIAKFHIKYEQIHPFQDGNGRTGRIILYKECLRNGLLPCIIHDENKSIYYHGLSEWQLHENHSPFMEYLKSEQAEYKKIIKEYLTVYSR